MTYTKILWGIILSIFFAEIIWIKLASFSFYYSSRDLSIYGLLFLSLSLPYLFYKKFRPDPKILLLLVSTAWLLCYTGIIILLTYLAYTTNRPLATHIFAAADSYLGIYSPAIVLWFSHHDFLNTLFSYIYTSIFFQKPFILLYFSFKEDFKHLQSFLMQYLIAGLITVCIGAFFPTEGSHAWYHFPPTPSQLSALHRLYELRQNIVDIRTADGIITFPSFHTTLGILYMYAFRQEKKIIFIPIFILNILLIFSCLSHGGHFFVDILAGIVVAIGAIGIEEFIIQRLCIIPLKKQSRTAVASAYSVQKKNPPR